MTAAKFNIWDGVYASFEEAPVRGLGFEDPGWRTRSANAARDARAAVYDGRALDHSLRERNSVLATVAATLLGQKERVRILDFGGGPAFGYLVLQALVPKSSERIDYHIVEVEGVCHEAQKIFDGTTAPTFHTSLPESGEFDIVFTASTLQYIADWRGICRKLASYDARYLAFSDVYAGRVSSYVTLQAYYESRIAHWILSEEEFVNEITSLGYFTRLKTLCNVRCLGAEGPLPMGNLPAERQIAMPSHFLFSRPWDLGTRNE